MAPLVRDNTIRKMKSDFIPPVSEGGHYKTPDGEILEVSYYLPEESGIEETVGYFFLSNPKDGKEANIDMWLAMNLTPCSEETTTIHSGGKNGPDNPGGNEGGQNPGGKNDPDNPGGNEGTQNPGGEEGHEIPEHEGVPHNPSVTRNPGELDPKLQELESFLRKGPEINAQFFPFRYDVEKNDLEEQDIIEGYNKTLQEIDDLREQGKNPKKKGGAFNELLWWFGGLDKSLLRMCPADWAKKAGMGGTILGTAVLATLSGGFAAYTVAENWWLAAAIGLIWGAIIFNLDRYLVNSMYSDGEPTISKQEIYSGLPRIIIAVFLGIVISTPIELKIFEGVINESFEDELRLKIQRDKEICLKEFNNDTIRLLNELNTLEKERSIIQQCESYEDAGWAYLRTKDSVTLLLDNGKPKANARGGTQGRAYKALKDEEQIVTNLISDKKNEYDTLLQSKDSLIKNAEDETKSSFKEQQGLSKKIEVLLNMTTFFKEKKDDHGKPITKINDEGETIIDSEFNALWLVRTLISLMFIILEILPVVNKMMQTDGEYDKLIDLESDTMEKLARAKEANNMNLLRGGKLSRYKRYILGARIREFEDDQQDMEDSDGFIKKEPLREDKNLTDDNNQDIFNEAQALAKAYVISEMRRIFGNTGSSSHGSSEEISHRSGPTNGDPTSEAKEV